MKFGYIQLNDKEIFAPKKYLENLTGLKVNTYNTYPAATNLPDFSIYSRDPIVIYKLESLGVFQVTHTAGFINLYFTDEFLNSHINAQMF